MKKFSSFLYNDSPIDKEYSGSSTQDEGTELKVDNDLNCKVEVVTFNNQVSRHLPTQLENCNAEKAKLGKDRFLVVAVWNVKVTRTL